LPNLSIHAQEGAEDTKPLVVTFSKSGGFYNQNVLLSLAAEGIPIYYTTDGSKPNEYSTRYDGKPIFIDQTTVLRAVALKGEVKSKTFTQTFFISESPTRLPVVSVSMAPATLFDPIRGVMRTGHNADETQPNMPGANFWTRKEYTCNVEIFETDKRCVSNGLAGFRIFGGYSRVFPQKSIVLIARKKYGKKYFKHKIFGADDRKKHKYLVLRNGGSDNQGAHCRDELMAELTKDWDIETQDYRPAILYLNGKYWGIYHIREKINARFLQDHTDADKDSLDLLEHKNTVREGVYDRYEKMLNYIKSHDVSQSDVYTKVQSMMDVNNFCDYQIAQIYCHNTDAGGNVRYWRAHRPGAQWRWILFDTDWGFGLHKQTAYRENSLDFFLEANGPEWPNPPWSTFLLRNLLQNEDFKTLFVNRLCDRLNTSFSTENVLSKIDFFEKILAYDMPRHLDRWNQNESEWRKHMDILRTFAEKRPNYLHGFFNEKFATGDLSQIEIEKPIGGAIMVNRTIRVENKNFSGQYFENYPLQLQAVPEFGYKFVGWEGISAQGRMIKVRLRPDAPLKLRAKFEPYQHPLHDQLFINEVCSFNKKTGDWVEIYNGSKETLNLEGWTLTDRQNEFIIPNVRLKKGEYLILCQDSVAFRTQFPSVANVCGSFGFGLDKAAERLAIYASDGAAVDSIYYRVEPQEGAYTIDLLMQNLDNASNSNWNVRQGEGSPGQANPLYLASVISAKKDTSIRIGLAISLLLVAILAIFKRKSFA
jgi:CotH kinase protein/Lamin Tail Domain/Chitobiase/beta-hexosaminidase C-terminal domain